MKNNKNFGFTLVELIVVITILAILGTVGFISFSNHLSWTRDTNRLTQLSKIHSGLEVYSTKNKLPLPEDKVEVWASWSLVWYQGYIWKNTLAMIEYEKWWIDPRDEQYFTYYVTADKIHFQLMAFLEDENSLDTAENRKWQFLIPKANALNYTKRFPTVYWEKLGVLTESITNLPIQEVDTIISSWYLDVFTTTGSYTASFTNNDRVTWTGIVLNIVANPEKSCYSILKTWRWETDWIYEINPTGNSPIKAYCDMTTDWGGWTLVLSVDKGVSINFTDVKNNFLNKTNLKSQGIFVWNQISQNIVFSEIAMDYLLNTNDQKINPLYYMIQKVSNVLDYTGSPKYMFSLVYSSTWTTFGDLPTVWDNILAFSNYTMKKWNRPLDINQVCNVDQWYVMSTDMRIRRPATYTVLWYVSCGVAWWVFAIRWNPIISFTAWDLDTVYDAQRIRWWIR